MASCFEKYLIRHKIFYLLLGFQFYVCYYFRGQYFKHVLHINESKFAGFSAGISLLTFFASFFWTRIADRYEIHKSMLLVFAFLSSAAFSALSFSGFSAPTCMTLAGLYVLFGMAMPPLADKIILDDLAAKGLSKDLYARQMVFAIVSYGVVTLGISYFIHLCGYHVIFPFLAIFTALFMVFTFFFMNVPKGDHCAAKECGRATSIQIPKGKSNVSLLRHVFNLDYLFFLFVILANGFSRFFMSFFLNLYLTETVSMTPIQSACSAIFGILLEIFMFTRAKFLLNKVGIYWMLTLGQLAMVIRLWMYYILPSKVEYLYVFFIVELLKGTNLGFVQPSAVKLSSMYAPKGLEGTFQGIYFGVFSGLGGFLAGLYANRYLTDSNFKILLYHVSMIMTIVLLLYILRYIVYEKFKKLKTIPN